MRRCLLCGSSASGAAGGFITGLALTGDFDKAWSMAGQGALSGGITGGVLGGYRGYKAAQHAGNNPWTGESNISQTASQTNSSFRTEPNNLNEKLAMDEAKTGMGKVMMHCEIKHPNW